MATSAPLSRGSGARHRGELRLRIEGAFSVAQMCQLADKWNLDRDPRWEKSGTDAAHGLLRAAEKRFGLLELVRRLRIEGPLFEWPDLDEDALAEWGPPPSVAAPTIADLAGEATVVSPPPDVSASAPPPPSKFASEPFPGTTNPRDVAPRGIDPTMLLAIAGIMLAVVIVAFGAGLLWSRRAERATIDASASAKPAGPALVAAHIFDDALAEVADRCDMVVDGPTTKDVLAAAQKDCANAGSASSTRKHDASYGPGLGSNGSQQASKRTPLPARDDAQPAPAQPPAETGRAIRPTCISRCGNEHSTCVSACGPEPSDANRYDSWQSCSTHCLTSESRCRLACR